MQINRLFEIVYILLNKNKVTAKELSVYFEVSQRTIYRDIETLCEAGIPVYTTKGRDGGIMLMDNFVLNKSILSKEEQNDILSALQGLNATRYRDDNAVLTKLSAVFGTDSHNWIEIDFSDWSNTQKERIALIKSAVINKNVIIFEYFSSYGEKSLRCVEPIQLWFKEKTWYLKAFCRDKQSIRTFRLSRIKNLKVTDETFVGRVTDNIPLNQNKENPKNIINLKLNLDSSQAYRVYDEFDENNIIKNGDNSFTVTSSFPVGEWVYGYILSFGCFAEVLEPLYIREIIKERLKKALRIYC